MICVSDNFAGEKNLNIFRIIMICVEENFAVEKVFENFQDNDELGLRQFCRRKSSLNSFRIKMICV